MEIYFYSSGVRREAVMKNHMQISSLKMFLVSVGFLKNTIIISDISEMEVAPLYKLLVHCLHRFLRSLIILFILFKLLSTASTLECMPIVREGWNAIGIG